MRVGNRKVVGRLAGTFFLGAVTILGTSAAYAQNQAPEQQAQSAEDRQAIIATQLRASEAAISALSNPDCLADITYAQILSDPDNIDLNVCYALQKIDSGDVRGASATLERILLIAPQALNVRYLYAIVMLRLDSIDEAEREFQTVASADLTPEVREQVEEYLAEIE